MVERPFCAQLRAMGRQWIEGDTDVAELTERVGFREVLLKGRLATALRRLNLRDGQPWLDDDRIRRIIEKLEKAPGHRLMAPLVTNRLRVLNEPIFEKNSQIR